MLSSAPNMRTSFRALGGGAVLLSLFQVAGCKVEHEAPLYEDAGDSDADAGDSAPYDNEVGIPDASASHCTLFDGTDPVAFCVQKTAMSATHYAAFSATKGLVESWNATTSTPDTNATGTILHDWHDDVGYSAACALYLTSAQLYGDTQITQTIQNDLVALAPLMLKELSPLPAEYTGETYQRLRVAGVGLSVADDTMDSQSVLAVADAYAEAIYKNYYVHLPPLSTSTDGGVPEAGPADAGHVDGGAAIPNGVFGTPRSGSTAYVTADVATAAYALLDLAQRNPNNAANSAWQAAAEGAFEHIYQRARDPLTGLYYTALVVSDDPGHDTIDSTVADAGTLLTDTTATVGLALSRAQALVAGSPLTLVANYPFSNRVDVALAALNAASLYDYNPPIDAGDLVDAGPSVSGFYEGYVPATKTFIESKATRANAYALALIHRQVAGAGTMYAPEAPSLFQTLTETSPPGPPNGSLFSVVAAQSAFFRASSRNFEVLAVSSTEPHPGSYQTAAVVAAIEGLNELLYGTSNQ